MNKNFDEKIRELTDIKKRQISAAQGQEPADLVLKNAAYVNVFSNEICTGDIAVTEGLIVGLGRYSGKEEIDCTGKIVLPGFIDAHIHLESSLVNPCELAKAVIPRGTTALIADPHEIANVLGTDGIEYMIQSTEGLPLDIHFMLPSCVPASPQDESGAVLSRNSLDALYKNPRVLGLGEMMNFPGVLSGNTDVLEKLSAAEASGRKIDGHAPGLTGKELNTYIAAGASSEHECFALDEALEKLCLGQMILIREGTAARNVEALAPLLCEKYGDRCMFCTDDKHPGDLLKKGHIDYIVRKAIALGADPIIAIKAASYNPARHFGLTRLGAVAPGFSADILIADNLRDLNVEKVFKNGVLWAENGKLRDIPVSQTDPELTQKAMSTFHRKPVTAEDFEMNRPLPVIGMIPGQIITEQSGLAEQIDVKQDILKIVLVERYGNSGRIGVGYIKGLGLQAGAIAASVAHDSHNIIAAGTDEKAMAEAVNRILAMKGGFVVWGKDELLAEVPLEIGGIMSRESLQTVHKKLEAAKSAAYSLGASPETDPFMSLSFMALPVIPTLRITTRGLFDVTSGQYL